MSETYCDPFSLLADVCNKNADASSQDSCKNYRSMCEASGTLIEACASKSHVPGLLSRTDAVADVLNICQSGMSGMKGCAQCTSNSQPDCEHPILALADLCEAMPGMNGCEGFVNMCGGLSEDFEGLCGSLTGHANATSGAPFCAGSGMSMMMTGFVWSPTGSNPCVNLLFEEWTIDSSWKLALSLIGIVGLGLLNGLLVRTRRNARSSWFASSRRKKFDDDDSASLGGATLETARAQAAMFVVIALQLFVAYMLMLVVMTYVGVFVMASVIGVTIGHMLFSMSADVFSIELEPCCQDPDAEMSTLRRRGLAARNAVRDNGNNVDDVDYVRLESALNSNDVVPTWRLRIGGTTCGSCVKTVSDALSRVDGVDDVNVSMLSGKVNQTAAVVRGNTSEKELRRAIDSIGFLVLTCGLAGDGVVGRGDAAAE